MEKQELLLRLSMFENEAKQIQEQAELANQQIAEFEVLKNSLDKLENEEEKEFLAALGKGVFIKSEIKDKELFVNIGNGIVIKKKPEETKKIIERQIGQLESLRTELVNGIEKLNSEMQKLIEEAQRQD